MPTRDPRHGVRPSLWLLPDETTQLSTVLAHLASTHGGPFFAPHLTLLGSIPGTRSALLAQTKRLARSLSPLTLQAAGVHGASSWFRCIALHLAMQPALRRARALAEELCGDDARPWVPHISLLYADLSATARAAAIATLPPMPSTVCLSTLALVETVGPPEAWLEHARFSLLPLEQSPD